MIACLLLSSCTGEKKVDERFSTPKKTYALWLDTAVKGDIVANEECMTNASRRFMDQQAKFRDLFIQRMTQSAVVFMNYSISDEKIKEDKAIVVIREPKSGHAIAVPLQLEEGGWKVDLIAMFGS